MSVWNSELNERRFNATGSMLYALATVSSELLNAPRRRSAPTLFPVKVHDFIQCVRDCNKVDFGDQIQNQIHEIIVPVLLSSYENIDPSLIAFKEKLPTHPLTGLIPALLPYDSATIDACRAAVMNKTFATDEITSKIHSLAETGADIRNWISCIVYHAFATLLKRYIISNPLLLILEDADLIDEKENVRTAATKLNYKSPRLNDLVDAIEIISGQIAQGYNEAVLADQIAASRIFKDIFPDGSPPNLKDTLTHSPKSLIILQQVLLQYYKQLQKLLADYCAARPQDVGSAIIAKSTKEVLTPNVYLNLSLESLDDVKNVASLLPREERLGNLNLEMTLWNGDRRKIESVGLAASDMREMFLQGKSSSAVAHEVAAMSGETLDRSRIHAYNRLYNQYIATLTKLVKNSDVGSAISIYEDIVIKSKSEVNGLLKQHKDLHDAAVSEATQTSTADDSNLVHLHDYKAKNTEAINKITYSLLASIYTVRDSILNSWGEQVSDKAALENICSVVFRKIALPLMPMTTRYMHGSRWLVKSLSSREISSVMSATVVPELTRTLNSPEFAQRYDANERDYRQTEKNLSKIEVVRSVAMSAVSDEAILLALGLDNASIEKIVAEHIAAYGSSTNATKMQRNLIDKLIKNTYDKYNASTDLQRKISPDALAILMSHKIVDTHFIDEIIQTAIQNKFDLNDDPRAAEFLNNFATDFYSIKAGKKNIISTNTLAGAIRRFPSSQKKYLESLQPNDDIKGKKKQPPTPSSAIMSAAQLGYATYVAGQSYGTVSDFLYKNKIDSSIADSNWRKLQRPRNMQELADLVGAFADPIPGIGAEFVSRDLIKRKRLVIRPGERFDHQQVEMEKLSADTVARHLSNVIRRIGGTITGNPVFVLRAAMRERVQAILKVSPAYKDDIKPYTVGGNVPYDQSPFIIAAEHPAEIVVDFDEHDAEHDVEKDVDLVEDAGGSDVSATKDFKAQALERVKLLEIGDVVKKRIVADLSALSPAYFSTDAINQTMAVVLSKYNIKETLQFHTEQPAEEYAKELRTIDSIINTIFSGSTKLNERLTPSDDDDIVTLSGKNRELMKYLALLTEAAKTLEFAARRAPPALLSVYTSRINSANRMRSSMIEHMKVINKYLVYNHAVSEEKEKTDSIRANARQMISKFNYFIERMRKDPFYGRHPEIIERVQTALSSLIDTDDVSQLIDNTASQTFLLIIENRMRKHDLFDDFMLEVDGVRFGAVSQPKFLKQIDLARTKDNSDNEEKSQFTQEEIEESRQDEEDRRAPDFENPYQEPKKEK